MAAAFGALFAVGEILYHVFKVNASVTRKIIHTGTGLLTMAFPPLIGNHWLVLALCGSFLLILLVSFPLNLLPSINAVDRKTHGSFIYPVVVYLCFMVYDYFDAYIYYYLPILILAICDPIAELIGKNYPWKPYVFFNHQKTISGSLGFFGSAWLLSSMLLFSLEELSFFHVATISFFVSLLSTFAEAISHKGYDNLTIPLSVQFILVVAHTLNLH